MTETIDNSSTPEDRATSETRYTNVDPVGVRYQARPSRLYRALAWVGIAAGSLFIVATVFFSGYILGHQGGGAGHHGPHRAVMKMVPGFDGPRGPKGPGGPMEPGGPMGPGGPDAERGEGREMPPTPQTSTVPRP